VWTTIAVLGNCSRAAPSGRLRILWRPPRAAGVDGPLRRTGAPLARSVRKGAVWWLRQRERDGVVETALLAVQSPDLLQLNNSNNWL
ncbi:MAG: hypothetical protein ACTS8S_19735, partial [Giesbergeria sp.]